MLQKTVVSAQTKILALAVTSVRVFTRKKLSKQETDLVEQAIYDVAKHLTDAAEFSNYPAHRLYHFKLAYAASTNCTVEYFLTEQARHVVDYETFISFMEYVCETANSFKLMTIANRQLLTNLLTDAISLAFRWLTPSKRNQELIIDLHVSRVANANTVPFNRVKAAA